MIKLNEIQDVKSSENPIIRQMSQYGHEQVVLPRSANRLKSNYSHS